MAVVFFLALLFAAYLRVEGVFAIIAAPTSPMAA